MQNQIQTLGRELLDRFSRHRKVTAFELLYPDQTSGLPPMRGRGFYPAADGLWKENGNYLPITRFPCRPIMFVGQDFDAQTQSGDYSRSIACGYQEEWGSTWRNLTDLIKDADIPLTDCFFTNLFPGVRIGDSNTGPSTALKDPVFVSDCVDFLDAQIRIVNPRAVVVMGIEPFKVIMRHWRSEQLESNYSGIREIDRNGLARFSFSGPYSIFEMGFIVHPAFGPQNYRFRSYKDSGGRQWAGREAELAILRDCSYGSVNLITPVVSMTQDEVSAVNEFVIS